MKRVLIAVSGRGADDACGDPIAFAASLPWKQGTEFRVLTVAESVGPPPMAEVVPGAVDVTDLQQAAGGVAANAAAIAAGQLEDHGLQAKGVSVRGDAKTAICDYAKEWHADLIVVGSCDRTALEKFFLGSVSQSVVKHAPCSVLVVRGQQAG